MKAQDSSPVAAGRVVLVTGGSRGIGAAICRRLAISGAAVFVASRQLSSCQALADELQARGATAWPLALDVTSPESIQRGIARAQKQSAELGGVGWLVNNAGIAESAPLSAREDPGSYERHMRVNFHGPRLLLEELLPSLRAAHYGRVVNLASSAGLRGYAYVAAYCASKFALVGYTLAAALELGRDGVTSNAVCPHYVDSPMLQASIQRLVDVAGKTQSEARAFFQAQNPSGKLVAPEQVALAVESLLLGEENGCLLELDGSDEFKYLHPNRGS